MIGHHLFEAVAFLAFAERGGYVAAARDLGLTQSTVSRRIAELEARTGLRLLARSIRPIILTEDGKALADSLRDVLSGLSDAEGHIQKRDSEPRGVLRITMPSGYGRNRAVPVLARVALHNPKLRLDLDLSDRFIDIVDEGFDIAIRLGESSDFGTTSQYIDRFSTRLYAAPAYFAAHGCPKAPSDLRDHYCVVQRPHGSRTIWRLNWQGEPMELAIDARWLVNDIDTARTLAVAGAGIAMLPSYLVEKDLAAGLLMPLLTSATLPETEVFAVYRRAKSELARIDVVIKAFTDVMSLGRTR